MQRGAGILGILPVGVLVKSGGWKEGPHERECPESEVIPMTAHLTNVPEAGLNKRQLHRHLDCDVHQELRLAECRKRNGRQNAMQLYAGCVALWSGNTAPHRRASNGVWMLVIRRQAASRRLVLPG